MMKFNLNGQEYTEFELEMMAYEWIEENFDEDEMEICQLRVFGSRSTGTHREDSDLDIYFEYTGRYKESAVFNVLNGELEVNGIEVDFFPVKLD